MDVFEMGKNEKDGNCHGYNAVYAAGRLVSGFGGGYIAIYW